MGLNTLSCDAMVHALSFASAATLIRCALACCALRAAAEGAARLRAQSYGLELATGSDAESGDSDEGGTRPWERLAQRPLAAVFAAELAWLLRRAPHDASWRTSAAFVPFRLTERDLDWVLGDGGTEPGAPLLVLTGTGAPEWLHECSHELCQLYEATADGRPADWGELAEVGLRTQETLWHLGAPTDYLALTAHLALHPVNGRPTVALDALLRADDTGRLADLRAWLRDADGRQRARYEADVRAGLDAAVLLSHFGRCPFTRRLEYGGVEHQMTQYEVERALGLAAPPSWQRDRPSPFEAARQQCFLRHLFDPGPTLHNPHHDDHPTHTCLHTAVGDRDGPWFVATLAFYDAIERRVR